MPLHDIFRTQRKGHCAAAKVQVGGGFPHDEDRSDAITFTSSVLVWDAARCRIILRLLLQVVRSCTQSFEIVVMTPK